MPVPKLVAIDKLNLDLNNFRTVPQPNEIEAIKAMISIDPDWFWALMNSILDDGYLLTDNILLLNDGSSLIVKEGNRRIGALKLIHGLISTSNFIIPDDISDKILNLGAKWKKDNYSVPCAIFDKKDAVLLNKIVTRTHGKGEKAGRKEWKSVAKARYNRDINKASEFGLELLEKYLSEGRNLTGLQRDRWAGNYNLTVLDEAIRKIAPRFGYKTAKDLSHNYPKIKYLDGLENLIRAIGLEEVKFSTLRDSNVDFASIYGIPAIINSQNGTTSPSTPKNNGSTTTDGSSTTNGSSAKNGSSKKANPNTSYATNDPKSINKLLKNLTPQGSNRHKVVTLRDELSKLKIKETPLAFCFVLRSMFEISAKAYCDDNSLPTKKNNGDDKALVDLLRDVTNHLTSNKTNKAQVKLLHGPLTEITRADGILSVTSMNHLVHNTSFSVQTNDICTLFSNIFPLLLAMN